jgi:YfiH family protein
MILPSPGAGFQWRDTAFGPALVCLPLEALAPHLFTTRAWTLGQSSNGGDAGWVDVAASFGLGRRSLVRLRQVHGRGVRMAEAVDRQADGPPAGDILVSRSPDLAIAVQAADCVPMLIADRRLGSVAAAHAGWRGLAAGVPQAAIAALVSSYGSRPDDLIAALGPSVGACCYEVGPEVKQAFVDGGVGAEALARWFHRAPTPTPDNPSMPGVIGNLRPGQLYFDGWVSAREQLLAAGLAEDDIFSATLCTASHPDLFPSYRRDGTAAGRIAAAVIASPRP